MSDYIDEDEPQPQGSLRRLLNGVYFGIGFMAGCYLTVLAIKLLSSLLWEVVR